ncbi:hypothetical protein G5I_10664 [Acromyrmex echinatior]|uniref:Uncharacterized protein n=1 Tax=Acromyrmex echinatior TaxID=103372 RepID=F4WXH9_ACREC|nr:hypothetical protein G5I_10664 [Acromyrmex echinatior]
MNDRPAGRLASAALHAEARTYRRSTKSDVIVSRVHERLARHSPGDPGKPGVTRAEEESNRRRRKRAYKPRRRGVGRSSAAKEISEITKREEERRSRRGSTQEEEEEVPVDVRCDSIAIRRFIRSSKRSSTGPAEIKTWLQSINSAVFNLFD